MGSREIVFLGVSINLADVTIGHSVAFESVEEDDMSLKLLSAAEEFGADLSVLTPERAEILAEILSEFLGDPLIDFDRHRVILPMWSGDFGLIVSMSNLPVNLRGIEPQTALDLDRSLSVVRVVAPRNIRLGVGSIRDGSTGFAVPAIRFVTHRTSPLR